MKRNLPCPIDTTALGSLLPDVPGTVFPPHFDQACQDLDRYVGALAAETANALELSGGVPPIPDLLTARGWSPEGAAALLWLMDTLELYRMARRGRDGWRIEVPAPPQSSSELATAAPPECAPAYRILELAARALPGFLAGSTRGEDVLFGPATMGLWFDYFSNRNPHYAPNNALTAVALAEVLPADATILELGGGAGSAAVACLETLQQAGRAPAHYVFTEVQPAFLRRGIRAVTAALPPGCRLTTGRADINQPLDLQLVEGGFHGVLAVNTLHLARDLTACLSRLRQHLLPGGVLVLGELIRPPDGAVHLELPFTLLADYYTLPLDPDLRPRPGFLTDSQWLAALAEAGFSRTRIIPAQLAACVEQYPGFYSGVVVGWR